MDAKKAIVREGLVLTGVAVAYLLALMLDVWVSFQSPPQVPIIIRTLLHYLPAVLLGGYGAYMLVRIILWAIKTLRKL